MARARIDETVDEELRFHLEERIEEFVAAGMTREQAAAEARRRFGDYGEYRRQARVIDERRVRGRDRAELLDTLLRETRHAARALRRTPSFASIAVVTLALGIGAAAAVYTMLEAVVLRPLPYPDAGSLVAVMHPAEVPGTGASKWGLSQAGYFHFARGNRTLAELGAYTTGYTTVVEGGEAERVRAAGVTQSLLSVLRARPAAGRLIMPDDDRPGAAPVAMLGYDFWQRRFGGDPAVIGRTVRLGTGDALVVGVMARGFTLPRPGAFDTGGGLAIAIDVWTPLALDPASEAANSHYLLGVARLRPGATADAAQRDLQRLTGQLTELFPRAYSPGFVREYKFRMGVLPLRDEVLGDRVARMLWLIFGAVALVLLIACANIANLFLVRMEARRRETAIRAALGAGRTQLAAHSLAESLLLTAVAGALGVAFAYALLEVLLSVAPPDTPRLAEVAVRWTTVAFAAGTALVAGIAFGLFPVLRARLDTSTLRDGARGMTPSPRRRAVRNALVVSQVALALMLLAAAGLMLRSVAHLRGVRAGFEPRGVLAFTVALPATSYDSATNAAAFHRELQARLASLPGVRDVGAATGLPLRDFGAGCAVVFREGQPFRQGEDAPCVTTPKVTPGFFRAMGISVIGREPEWRDLDAGTGAVVVTRALAERLWPGENPIGKGINSNGGDESGYYRVVGVVPELRAKALDQPPTEAVFYPAVNVPKSWIWGPMRGATYVVRTSLDDPTSLAPAVRRTLRDLDAQVPMANLTTMEEIAAQSMARVSFIMLLLGIAAAMALLLSAVGLYGVISYLVGQRRAEIGVRIALGARVAEVARLVVMQSVRLALAGIAVGMVAAVAGTRLMRSLLFDVSPTDPVVLAAVALLLVVIAALASYAPARRAARIDPTEALKG
jgi:predicted permease